MVECALQLARKCVLPVDLRAGWRFFFFCIGIFAWLTGGEIKWENGGLVPLNVRIYN